MDEIKESNYFYCLSLAKELAMYLPSDHPKRVKVEKQINDHIKSKVVFKAHSKEYIEANRSTAYNYAL